MCLKHYIGDRYENPCLTDEQIDKIHEIDKQIEYEPTWPVVEIIYNNYHLEKLKRLLTKEHIQMIEKTPLYKPMIGRTIAMAFICPQFTDEEIMEIINLCVDRQVPITSWCNSNIIGHSVESMMSCIIYDISMLKGDRNCLKHRCKLVCKYITEIIKHLQIAKNNPYFCYIESFLREQQLLDELLNKIPLLP